MLPPLPADFGPAEIRLRVQLIEFYEIYNAGNVRNVDEIVRKYVRAPASLWAALERKYGLEKGAALAFVDDEEEDRLTEDRHAMAAAAMVEGEGGRSGHGSGSHGSGITGDTLDDILPAAVLDAADAVAASMLSTGTAAISALGLGLRTSSGRALGDGSGGGRGGGAASPGSLDDSTDAALLAEYNPDPFRFITPPCFRKAEAMAMEVARLQGTARTKAELFERMLGPDGRALPFQREALMSLAFHGIPETGGVSMPNGSLRAAVWRLLLGHIPWRTPQGEWEAGLAPKREMYGTYRAEFVGAASDTGATGSEAGGGGAAVEEAEEEAAESNEGLTQDEIVERNILRDARRAVVRLRDAARRSGGLSWTAEVEATALAAAAEDGMLGASKALAAADPAWAAHFADEEVREEVRKDVQRTHSGINFFAQRKTREALEAILLVFAKLNSGIKYVQGMNEVLAPIYFVLATDPRPDWAAHAEADTFYCFSFLMSEVRDTGGPLHARTY